MPRIARLDAPGVLHHVMGRGIKGGLMNVLKTGSSQEFWGNVDTPPFFYE
jgi:hypothetical protein